MAAADDAQTRRRVEAERACVAAIGGGCLAPVAAYHDGESLTALVADEDGAWVERRSGDDPASVARELAVVRRGVTISAQNRHSRVRSPGVPWLPAGGGGFVGGDGAAGWAGDMARWSSPARRGRRGAGRQPRRRSGTRSSRAR